MKFDQGIPVLHDSASAHGSHVGQAVILKCGLEEMRWPSHSIDLTSSDYRVIPN